MHLDLGETLPCQARRHETAFPSNCGLQLCPLKLGMYRMAIFKIRPEPESTGYQMSYLAGTGYL